ncbi:MAG: efflux RND transporter periplasmic adaptor subunit [Acidobacteriota bacterium]|nr:efflux RND transporter periplasmic adaptor subunit [Acidobacteriota bacterium]
MKKLWLIALAFGAGILVWELQQRSEPPRVQFTKAVRQTVTSIVSTNGKIEPIEYSDVRVEAGGIVRRLLVHLGDTVRAGQLIAELSQSGLNEDLQAAEARAAQAQADLNTLKAGGQSAARAELEGTISRLTEQRAAAQKNAETLERLVSSNAATKYELEQAQQSLADLNTQIRALNTRKAELVGKSEVEAAEQRLREAQANVRLSQSHIGDTGIRAPITGTIYDLPARQGAYLNIGDSVASVGKLDPVRVRVYVDEPELGRVAVGQPVRITWDALPGREWTGTVEKKPTEIVALGSRQVGEVLCTIGNPNHDLAPGANVNAFIQAQVAQNTLTIPKTAVRRDQGTGVYVLQPDRTIKWQAVKTGIGDALRVEILSGLHEGDAVAEPSDLVLKSGMEVKPVTQ